MAAEASQSYAQKTADLLQRLGATASAPAQPRTIEEAALPRGAAPTSDVGVTRLTDIIPMPQPGMELPAMKDLYEAYVNVVNSGAYLSNFTGLKGASVETNDPIELGKRRMSAQEVRVFEWWLENGNSNEFDWDVCTRQGHTPEGKRAKFEKELQALNWMYGRQDLTEGNLYWLREEKPLHFQCVTAYAKIIAAGNDIQNGVPDRDPDALREYETCKKIIGTCDKNINDIMKMIHDLLQPLQEAKNVVEARKHWAAKRAGIALKTVGTIAHKNAELNLQPVGGVTRPDEMPRGKRVERTGIVTLSELVSMQKKRKAGEDWKGSAPKRLHKEGDFDLRREDPLEYRPASPTGVPQGSTKSDLTKPEKDAILSSLLTDSVPPSMLKKWAEASTTADEEEFLQKVQIKRGARGRFTIPYPRTRTNKMDCLIAGLNRAVLKQRVTYDFAKVILASEGVVEIAATTGLFTDPSRLEGWKNTLLTSAGAGGSGASGPGDHEMRA